MTTHLSGYRIMWMVVMFDLPTKEKSQKRAYTRFRHYLLDNAFQKVQYSVYMRMLPSKERVESMENKIRSRVPDDGLVQIFTITDKQYENIQTFIGKTYQTMKSPEQLQIF